MADGAGIPDRDINAAVLTFGNALTRGLGLGLLTGVFLFGCQGPDEFLRADEDAGLSGFGGSRGTGGDTGTGGFVAGTGGNEANLFSHRSPPVSGAQAASLEQAASEARVV